MRVRVLYFAIVRERLGREDDLVELAGLDASLDELKQALVALSPALAELLPHVRIAVDQEFVPGDLARLRDGVEVALIPPVSGGSSDAGARASSAALLRVTVEPLEIEPAVASVAGTGAGAIDVFVGTVRDASRGQRGVALEYEAYAPMAERQFARFAEETATRWPGCRAAIVHRVGRLVPGERSVVIAVASPHRAEAFDACRHLIERLKADAPIWKREIYRDGAVWVGWGS